MLELVLAALALLLFGVTALARSIAELRTRLQRIEADVARLRISRASEGTSDPDPVPQAARPPSGASPIGREPPRLPPPAINDAREIPPVVAAPTIDRTLEQQIGSRWMLLVGTLVLVLGVAFFIKYAFENEWIDERARVALGTAAGIAAWVAGVRFVSAGYVLYGRIVSGGGLAIIYLSAYAASALYEIVPASVAFGWMTVASAATVITADRQRSIGLALTAIVLAYVSPFLVGSDVDRHLTLFLFDLTLAAATVALVARHGWPWLGAASFALTWITYGIWASASYQPEYFASTELYLTAVTAAFLVVRRQYTRERTGPQEIAALALTIGPALYYVASIAVLFDHSVWLLVFFIAFTAVAIAFARRSPEGRLAVWVAVALPFFVWTGNHVVGAWYIATIATATGMYVLHLFAQVEAFDTGAASRDAEIVLFHANGLGLFAFTYLAVTSHSGSTAALAALLAAWYLLLAYAIRTRAAVIVPHALALAFAFAAVAVAVQLTGPWIAIAWAAEGFGVTWIGLRLEQPRLRAGGALLIALATLRLAITQFGETFVTFTPVLNARSATGAFIVALMYGIVALYRRTRASDERRTTTAWIVAANVLTVALMTADINSYWELRDDRVTAAFARELSISLAWGAYAMGAMTVGFRRRSATLRYFALALFGATVTKMFLVDLLELGGVYRITGFVALGLALLGASFLYQRQRTRTDAAET